MFANYRESVERIHQYLLKANIAASIYHGELDQQRREQAVAMLNNGSINLLIATDLAARGLDIDKVEHIVHYHMPVNQQAYIHRNGRTARVDATGNAYVITAPDETLAEWISIDKEFSPNPCATTMPPAKMATLYFQSGKKEKLSRGDIVGFIANNCAVRAQDIGRIDVRDHYALAAIPRQQATDALQVLKTAKIKGKKVRISLLK